jgi:type IV pilus assembly protein PilO
MAKKGKTDRSSRVREKIEAFLSRVGALTRIQRLLICVLTFAVIVGGYYYFIFMPKNQILKEARTEYKAQVDKLATFKIKARALRKYEKKMALAQEAFNVAMKALPDKKELPSLLTGVSKAGSRAGLVFNLFQPNPVVNKDFYKEIPLSLEVEGRFHQIADFFFQVAGLNRIVNIQNMSMTADAKKSGLIQMHCSAVTYMFAEKAPSKKGKRKKRKKKG